MFYQANQSLGRDEWVVLLHGLGGSTEMWKRQIDKYRTKYNVLSIDLPGHGYTSEKLSKDRMNIDDVCKDILDIMESFNIQTACFAGISIGACIAIRFAYIYPEKVSGMILCGALIGLNRFYKMGLTLGLKLSKIIPSTVLVSFASHVLPRKTYKKDNPRSLFMKCMSALDEAEFISWLKVLITFPTIISHEIEENKIQNIPKIFIMGDLDKEFIKNIKKRVSFNENNALEVIPNCGHVCNIESPDRFNKLSMDFFKKNLKLQTV